MSRPPAGSAGRGRRDPGRRCSTGSRRGGGPRDREEREPRPRPPGRRSSSARGSVTPRSTRPAARAPRGPARPACCCSARDTPLAAAAAGGSPPKGIHRAGRRTGRRPQIGKAVSVNPAGLVRKRSSLPTRAFPSTLRRDGQGAARASAAMRSASAGILVKAAPPPRVLIGFRSWKLNNAASRRSPRAGRGTSRRERGRNPRRPGGRGGARCPGSRPCRTASRRCAWARPLACAG
jgi:hypothetical protein